MESNEKKGTHQKKIMMRKTKKGKENGGENKRQPASSGQSLSHLANNF